MDDLTLNHWMGQLAAARRGLDSATASAHAALDRGQYTMAANYATEAANFDGQITVYRSMLEAAGVSA